MQLALEVMNAMKVRRWSLFEGNVTITLSLQQKHPLLVSDMEVITEETTARFKPGVSYSPFVGCMLSARDQNPKKNFSILRICYSVNAIKEG